MVPRTLGQMVQGQNVLTATPADTVRQACIVMAAANIGALPVVDGFGALVGMLSERDVIKRSVIVYRPSTETLVSQIMTPDPCWLPPEAKPREASDLMRTRKFRHLPICEGRHVIGIVSLRDFDARGNPIAASNQPTALRRFAARVAGSSSQQQSL